VVADDDGATELEVCVEWWEWRATMRWCSMGEGGGGPASIMGDGQKTLSGGGVVCSVIARSVMS
jgi:hypothetical protein